MEMERINDNLIKVMIDVDDLEERGINFLDLIGDQGSIEKFFYSILEEVDVDNHFHESEAVTFQVMPSSNGLELYISRANFEDMDAFWEDELTKRLKEKKQERQNKTISKEESSVENKDATPMTSNQIEDESDYEDEIFVFNCLEDFIKLARDWHKEDFHNSLYAMNGRYYLMIEDIEEDISEAQAYEQLMDLLEYGEMHHTTQAILEEYGQIIREHDALEFFGKNF